MNFTQIDKAMINTQKSMTRAISELQEAIQCADGLEVELKKNFMDNKPDLMNLVYLQKQLSNVHECLLLLEKQNEYNK